MTNLQHETDYRYYSEDLGKLEIIKLEMAAIPEGKFIMGSSEGEEGFDSEKPQHEVTVSSFLMGKYPITQAQWRAIASRTDLKVERDLTPNPSYFQDTGLLNYGDTDNRPVESISWHDAVEFCARLSKLTGREYRLPSEAEWEYACRAGTTTPYHFGETITGELANYNYDDYDSLGQTTEVGSYPPNAFGIYDMHGNVWEWCADDWHKNYEGAPADGSVWNSGDYSISLVELGRGPNNESINGLVRDDSRSPLRGGSWKSSPAACRSAARGEDIYGKRMPSQDIGFRVVCSLRRKYL